VSSPPIPANRCARRSSALRRPTSAKDVSPARTLKDAVAVDYIDPADDATDPELLERLHGKAAAFSLNEGETKTQDLKLITS
jgi:hypothetical protein